MHCINSNVGWVVIAMANKYEGKEFYIGSSWQVPYAGWRPLSFERSILYG